MSIRTFFNLLLRIIGLLLLTGSFNVILTPIQSVSLMIRNGVAFAGAGPFLVSLIVAAIYLAVCYACFFRPSAIIDLLKLHKGYDTDELYFGKNLADILLISVTVIGGYMVASAIPGFLSNLYRYFQQKHLANAYSDRYPVNPFTIDGLIQESAKIIIGLLMIGYRLQIANLWWAAEYRRSGASGMVDDGEAPEEPGNS